VVGNIKMNLWWSFSAISAPAAARNNNKSFGRIAAYKVNSSIRVNL